MDKRDLYKNIHELKDSGLKISQIAKSLGVTRPTVYKYLKMTNTELDEKLNRKRKKILDPYRNRIVDLILDSYFISTRQIRDILLEENPDLKVSPSTVRKYVRNLRDELDL